MGARYDKGRQLFCKSVGGLLGLVFVWSYCGSRTESAPNFLEQRV
ncbi:hypothetical protein SAMN03084138_01288 [Enterovibrio norvegicus DSM 15893]|uniref:Uncharacterized protein n=1 Tax=Enterovibrio norvegicus DSM 15893 TaxID=1121869 RepID=A0A1I5ME91_9GAMM|nr:hypothetical protein SAMN03084138_01288 [Enterovibrio norvegicus DSM 15893]